MMIADTFAMAGADEGYAQQQAEEANVRNTGSAGAPIAQPNYAKQWALSEAMRDPSVLNSTKDALDRAQEILDWVTKP